MRRLLTAAATASLLLAQAPVLAEGSADDIGVMSVSLKETIKPRFGFQGQTQGAGTPNQAGIGGFLPLKISENSIWFFDSQVNANFEDFNNYSSIDNTTVAGITFSTSSRLGYRWLNSDRSWMFGINGGYDTRPMATGYADTGIQVTDSITAFYQQAALNLEAQSDKFKFSGYALIPTGQTLQRLNSAYEAGALNVVGFQAGYNLNPSIRASAGYYYQSGDADFANGSGVDARLEYEPQSGAILGLNVSHDYAFDTRISGDVKWRFSTGKSNSSTNNKAKRMINAISSSPNHRDVTVQDKRSYQFCLNAVGFSEWMWGADGGIKAKYLGLKYPNQVYKQRCFQVDKRQYKALNYCKKVTEKALNGRYDERKRLRTEGKCDNKLSRAFGVPALHVNTNLGLFQDLINAMKGISDLLPYVLPLL